MALFLQGRIVHSLMTGNNLHFAKINVNAGPPTVAPTFVGETYFDSTNSIFYVGVGTSTTSDWESQSFQEPVVIISNGTIPSAAYRVIAEVDTSSTALTLTMPTHREGLIVTIVDFKRNSYTNNITLVRNSGIGTIDFSTSNYIIDSNGSAISFISQQSISNWAVVQ